MNVEINLDNKKHRELVISKYSSYKKDIPTYKKMYDYYKGDTDAILIL